MFVRFYVVNEVNTSTANVNVTLDGKVKNVLFDMTNVRFQIVMAMDTA